MSLFRRYPDMHPASYKIGNWAWLAHRISGAGIAAYLVAHILVISSALAGGANFNQTLASVQTPLFLALDIILIGVIIFHMLNGFRILLFDLGIGVRHSKQLFWVFAGVSAAALIATAVFILPFVLGRQLT